MHPSSKRACAAILLAGAMTPAFAAPPPKAKPAPAPAATRSMGSSPSSSAGGIEEGQIEIGGLFAWFKSDATDVGLAFVNGGYMYTDVLELRLGVIALLGDASGGFLTPGVDYYITQFQLPVMPYAGAGYALGYGDAKDISSIDLHVGVKQFLTERIALDYRFTYQQPTDSDYDAIQILMAGFSYYL
jgi:hypothetical protein